MLRALVAVPPILLFALPHAICTPAQLLPRAWVPVTSVPMKLPSITLPPFFSKKMPFPEVGLFPTKRLITSPRTVLLPAVILIPFVGPALAPFSSMIGLPANPGWVVPSMVTGSVIVGRKNASIIVCTPAPGMLKTIVSAPGLALASRIACLSDPAPMVLVLVTVKVIGAGVMNTVVGLW